MLNRSIRFLAATALSAIALPSFAALNILACEPEWGALAQALGGDKVSVYNATNAFQDPHHVQAKPSLLAKARNADMVICLVMNFDQGGESGRIGEAVEMGQLFVGENGNNQQNRVSTPFDGLKDLPLINDEVLA